MPLERQKERTDKQKAAARANGAKSLGPTTPQGKRKSARNSTKHGFLAQSLVLPNESRERFNRLFDSLWDQFQPTTAVEQILVQRMVAAQWRLMRVLAFENAGLLNEPPAPANAPAHLAASSGEQWVHPAAGTAAAFQSLHGHHGSGSVIQLSEMRYHRQFAECFAQLTKHRAASQKGGVSPNEPGNSPPLLDI